MIDFGFDPGTHFGWATKHPNGAMHSGVLDLSTFKNHGRKWMTLQGWLRDSLEVAKQHTVRVAYEKVRRHRGADAAHVYGLIEGLIHLECERVQIKPVPLAVGEIKRFATTSGNASKEGMMAAAWRYWPGYTSQDDNEADARWICECLGKGKP